LYMFSICCFLFEKRWLQKNFHRPALLTSNQTIS
jgi:hypothetical protein